MQPPINIGTVLQNRYRLIKILGQGGMGRTYLAEDQGRFNELCALKELIPAQTGNNDLEKSKKLFQREATILYQIQHPQVPQFRATFEQDQRFFLVQDYVEGKTYARMLSERKASGQRFSEAEVFQLLWQLLPVLAHLHNRGIIHRDISPDNIILRDRDRLPVLIDFGVVKELATKFQSPQTTYPLTTVGKLGYAPSEQIQTGRAYPSSDLYALAVTSVVLLTGRDPQELFDDTQLEWNWQRWVTLSPQLSGVLNRMLSYKPGDRYQSVAEVAQALQSPTNQPQNPNLSRVQTVAVGRRPDLMSSTSRPASTPAVIPATNRSWYNIWAIAVIGTVVATLSGIGSWVLVSSIITKNQRAVQPTAPPQTFPSPLLTASPTPTPTVSNTPTSTPTPTVDAQTINFNPDETAKQVSGQTRPQLLKRYLVYAKKWQVLSVAVKQGAVTLDIRDPDGEPMKEANNVLQWKGTVRKSGNYQIDVMAIQDQDTNFTLDVGVRNLQYLFER
jgi:serine/threonine-protein kinase